MKIQTVEYRALVTGPDYSNVTIGVTASMEPGETPELALKRCHDWVMTEHAYDADRRTGEAQAIAVNMDINRLREELTHIEQEVEEARRNYYDKVLPFMRRFRSIIDARQPEPEQESLDDVPF